MDFLLEMLGVFDREKVQIPNVKMSTSWCHNITASHLTPISMAYVTKQLLFQFMGLEVDCHSADLGATMLYTVNSLLQSSWAQANSIFLSLGPQWGARHNIFSKAWHGEPCKIVWN